MIVLRKVTLLATVVVMPGGLLVLCTIAIAFILMRTDGGRRFLAGMKQRVPERIKAPVRKVLQAARGEQLFLSQTSRVQLP